MTQVSLDALRNVQRLIGRLNAGADLAATLRAVVDGVVEGLGFGVAVVNLVHDDGTVEVVSVAGPQDVSDTLLGSRSSLVSWEKAFARSHLWGALRYEPHELADEDDLPTWVPDLPVVDDPDAWHPLDALYSPLYSITGDLVGVLSVDLPDDGRRPGDLQRELLEMYATQAGIAIDNARLAERLKASEESFRLAFENAPIGMMIVDLSPGRVGRFLRVNEAMCHTLGYSRRQLLERGVDDITHPDHRDADLDVLRSAVEKGVAGYQIEKRYLRADGSPLWVSLRSSVVRDSNGHALYGISQFEDISDRRAEHQELTRRAQVDPLTGLHNRASLIERVEAAMADARCTGHPGALMFCDLDAFKPVNDRHGHQVGDQVLAIMARRLEAHVRKGDTTSRFGGDEFVIVADDLSGERLCELVQRLRDAVAATIDVAGLTVDLTITVGTVPITGSKNETAEGLISAADADMYRRKPGARPIYAGGRGSRRART